MNNCHQFAKIMMQINKMASITIMIGGALINATAFVGGSHLAKYSSGDQNSAEEEKKRCDFAVEEYQSAYEKYQENRTKLVNWIATNDRVKEQPKQNFLDTDYALKLYNKVHNHNKSKVDDLHQRNGFALGLATSCFL